MWERGLIMVPQKDGSRVSVRYSVKVYDIGSRFGIDGGRISKLWLQIDGKCAANYDRGWDVKPTCEAAEIALQILLDSYQCEGGRKMKTWKVHTYATFRLADGQLPEVTIENIQAETAEEALQIAADHFGVTADGEVEEVKE